VRYHESKVAADIDLVAAAAFFPPINLLNEFGSRIAETAWRLRFAFLIFSCLEQLFFAMFCFDITIAAKLTN